jgi:NMD protein affecting ribosome stability and mRNA decay
MSKNYRCPICGSLIDYKDTIDEMCLNCYNEREEVFEDGE